MTDDLPLSESLLRQRLAPHPVRYFAQIGSTNDEARAWLEAGAPAGAVVIADEQTQGRGRHHRAWRTPPGAAVALSVVLRPQVEALPQIIMMGALAVIETVEAVGVQHTALKWPNDVLVNGRKVSGVLAETVWSGDMLRGVILGIGVNVSVDFAGSELEPTAISLMTELGAPVDRLTMLESLLARLDYWQLHLGTSTLYRAWKARLVTLGSRVTVTNNTELLTGIAEDVDESGVLLLRQDSGELMRVVAGDLQMGSTQ